MARITKKDIFRKYGIMFKDGKIFSPIGWIEPLLKTGNTKTGKTVATWSMLPTTAEFTQEIDGIPYTVKGTCCCSCKGCYATKGFYNMPSTLLSLFVNTLLAREHMEFVERAIMAQMEADHIELLRNHAAGDFFSMEYAEMWHRIGTAFPNCDTWTYTKVEECEHYFDDLPNVHVVPSIIPNIGYNFGHCDYIIMLYNYLQSIGEDVYICRCGFDKAVHCESCKGCCKHKYVLFLEHSTEYKAEKDPLFPVLRQIVEAQQDGMNR